MRTLDACPVCESPERTLAGEFNRFILHEDLPAGDGARYDYSICHGCGLLYAVHRPEGEQYTDLLTNFNETLGRADSGGNLVLYPGPLDDELRERLSSRAAAGAFVSEHAGLAKDAYLRSLLDDRKSTAPHADLLAAQVGPRLRGKRVLEIRSRTGALLDQLRRWCDVEPYAMPIFASQKLVNEEVYGIPTSELIDFDDFTIPFDGPFDLIIAKHMYTHALDPAAFFAAVRDKLAPTGLLYLYAEPDDKEAIRKRKSFFATMNPFHMQAFDRASFVRTLQRMGFEPTFVTHDEGFSCLAQLDPAARFEPISEKALRTRIEEYADWRLRSVAALPKAGRGAYGGEWKAIAQQAAAKGLVDGNGSGLRGRVASLLGAR